MRGGGRRRASSGQAAARPGQSGNLQLGRRGFRPRSRRINLCEAFGAGQALLDVSAVLREVLGGDGGACD